MNMLVAVSCSTHPALEYADTVDVTLGIGMHGNGPVKDEDTWTKAAGTEAETAIRSLRIIACTGAADGTEKVVYCSERITDISMSSQRPHVVYTVPGVPVGSVTFYVVANEETLGYTDEDFLFGEGAVGGLLADPSALNTTLFIDENNEQFPIKGFNDLEDVIAEKGLPMTGTTTVEVTADMGAVTVDLERMVAKILVRVENAVSYSIDMKKRLEFGNIVGDRTYLFPDNTGNRGDVPDDYNGYLPLTIDTEESSAIEAATTVDFFTAYILPCGGAGENGLSLTLYRNDGTSSTGTISGNVVIPRNTQMTILARINERVDISISFEVLPWEEYTVDIPVFD